MKNTITSLVALRQEKKKLKLEIELSKHEFEHSLGRNSANLKDFLIKKVAIPVGIVGLGVAGVNKLMDSDSNTPTTHHFGELLSTILPILATVAQTYFFKNVVDENKSR